MCLFSSWPYDDIHFTRISSWKRNISETILPVYMGPTAHVQFFWLKKGRKSRNTVPLSVRSSTISVWPVWLYCSTLTLVTLLDLFDGSSLTSPVIFVLLRLAENIGNSLLFYCSFHRIFYNDFVFKWREKNNLIFSSKRPLDIIYKCPELGTRQHYHDNVTLFSGLKMLLTGLLHYVYVRYADSI